MYNFIKFYIIIYLNIIKNYKIAVFDAGSTSTRLHIYNFDSQLSESSPIWFKKPLTMDTLDETIMYFIQFLSKEIPIGFYGTEGLREAGSGIKIIEGIKNRLADFNLKEVKILSQEEEANFLLEAFNFF